MIYEVPVRFSGRIMYSVFANSEEEALDRANELAAEADCGDLEDIDWETAVPVSYSETPDISALQAEMIRFLVPKIGAKYYTCRSLQLTHAEMFDTYDYKLYITESYVAGYTCRKGSTENTAPDDGEMISETLLRHRPLSIVLQDKNNFTDIVTPKNDGNLEVLVSERIVADSHVEYSATRSMAMEYAQTLAKNIRRNYKKVGNVFLPKN